MTEDPRPEPPASLVAGLTQYLYNAGPRGVDMSRYDLTATDYAVFARMVHLGQAVLFTNCIDSGSRSGRYIVHAAFIPEPPS